MKKSFLTIFVVAIFTLLTFNSVSAEYIKVGETKYRGWGIVLDISTLRIYHWKTYPKFPEKEMVNFNPGDVVAQQELASSYGMKIYYSSLVAGGVHLALKVDQPFSAFSLDSIILHSGETAVIGSIYKSERGNFSAIIIKLISVDMVGRATFEISLKEYL